MSVLFLKSVALDSIIHRDLNKKRLFYSRFLRCTQSCYKKYFPPDDILS